MKVSEVGMGTYYDPMWIVTGFLGWRRGRAGKMEALRAGLDSGITLVDTAEIYQSEPLVGEVLKGRRRDELFIATKVWSNHLHRDDLTKAFDRSLRRLGLDYIDLYQVHWPNPGVPIKETMHAMDELVSAGKLRHIGVSNFDLPQIQEANTSLPKGQLSSVQLNYSLIRREVEAEVIPYCQREGIALLAYYPLGHGKLAADQRLDRVAVKTGSTRAQTALAWLSRKEWVFPIPRASTKRHVLEDAGVDGTKLSDEDVKELDAGFPVASA